MSGSPAPRRSHANLDPGSREQKAARIAGLLRESIGSLEGVRLLDVGAGAGVIASYLQRLGASVTAVDVSDERLVRDTEFHLVRSDRLPFPDGTFDVVISNHVIEHVDVPPRHLLEIRRVLRHPGACYLATPNRLRLIEPHYRLPLLSLVPRPLADRLVRASRKGEYFDVRLLSYWELKALLRRTGFAGAYCAHRVAADVLHLRPSMVPSFLTPVLPTLNVMLTPERDGSP